MIQAFKWLRTLISESHAATRQYFDSADQLAPRAATVMGPSALATHLLGGRLSPLEKTLAAATDIAGRPPLDPAIFKIVQASEGPLAVAHFDQFAAKLVSMV